MMKDRLYIMWSPWRPMFQKIGVSNRPDLREKQVGAICLFRVRMPYAYTIEAAMHRYYKPLNVRFGGDGGSEWFLTANPIFALLAYNLHLWYGIAPDAPTWYFVALFLLPIPVDTMLILTAIASIVYAGLTLFLAGLIYFLLMSF
jgi:hypothetical protein